MRFFVITIATLLGATLAAPLPDGPWGVKKWIKINNIEYEVPMHLSPEEFRQSMLSVRSDRFQNVNVRTFQRPTPTSPDSQWALLSGFQQQQQRQTYPLTVSSRPLGASYMTPSYNQYNAGYNRPSVVTLPQPPITPIRAPQMSYPQPPTYFSRSQVNTGSRQWVKLAEGHNPIEVPAGRNPQEFLNSIRTTPSGFRYLSGKHAPIVQHVIPPPPPPVTKVTYEILPPPTKKAMLMPAPSKKSMILPPPPMTKGAYIPQIQLVPATVMVPVAPPTKTMARVPKKRMTVMPTKESFARPMYVAARPVGWGGKKW